MLLDKLYILHEYGAPRHFIPITYLQKKGFIKEISSMEFNIHIQIRRKFLSGIRHQDKEKALRIFHNLKELTRLLFLKNKVIIIGAAPFDPAVLFFQLLKKKNKVIYFTSWHLWEQGKWVKRPLTPKIKVLWYNFLSDVISVGVSQATCQGLKRLGYDCFHIPHSVDTRIFTPPIKKIEDKTIILFVGWLTDIKGVPTLLNVIRNTEWPRNTEFWFVGQGPYREHVISMENDYPVKYIGYVSDQHELVSIYQKAHILVLPSRSELFGIVLIEAMASGLPVVATDCVGPKEIIDNGNDGFIVSRENENQLKEKIIELIENPDLRSKMGENARQKAEQVYDIRKAAEKWKKVIKIVSEKK